MVIDSVVACLRRALRVIVSMFSQGVMIRINACTHILFVIVLGLVSVTYILEGLFLQTPRGLSCIFQ